MTTVPFVAAQGVALAIFVLVSACAGAWVASRVPLASAAERFVVAAISGMALVAFAFHAFALCGAFGMVAIATTSVLACLSPWLAGAATTWLGDLADWRAALVSRRAAAIVALGTPVLVLACYPPLAFDETLYHLPFARLFLRTGAMPFAADLRAPVFPPLAELLFAALLRLADPVATHVVSLAATLLAAGLVHVWSLRDSPARAWIATATFAGSPIVAYLSGTDYVEPVLGSFVSAATFATLRYRDDGARAWIVLAALLASAAAGTKYFGLFFVVALPIVIVATAPRGLAQGLRDAGLFSLVALFLLAPVYGRIFVLTGNPMFPLLPGVFGSSLWDPFGFPRRPGANALTVRLLLPVEGWLGLPHDGAFPPHSPFLPFAALVAPATLVLDRADRLLAILCVGFVAAAPPDARYLMTVLPIACVVLAGGVARVWETVAGRWPQAAATLFSASLCLAIALPGPLYAAWKVSRWGPPPASAADREAFLDAHVPLHAAIAELNRTRGSAFRVYVVHGENLVDYAEGALLGDWTGPGNFAYVLPLARDPLRFAAKLRDLGVTHLLVPRSAPDGPDAADPAFIARFRRVRTDSAGDLYELVNAAAAAQGRT